MKNNATNNACVQNTDHHDNTVAINIAQHDIKSESSDTIIRFNVLDRTLNYVLQLMAYEIMCFIILPFSDYIFRITFQKYFTYFVLERLT
jgi:hypothetical protein